MVLILYVLAEIATMIWLPTSSQASAGTVPVIKRTYRRVNAGQAQLHDRSNHSSSAGTSPDFAALVSGPSDVRWGLYGT